MSLNRVTNVFVSGGSAPLAAGSLASTANVTSGIIGIVGRDGTAIAAGSTIADNDVIYVVVGNSDGTIKRSMPIIGAKVNSYVGEAYAPSSRHTNVIGYNRDTGAGLIEVNNSTEYSFNLLFKNKKTLYSERPYRRSYRFTSIASPASATVGQLTVATQIYNAINDDAAAEASAIIVGNGTTLTTETVNGVSYTVFGGTNATAYGVEIMGDSLTQFSNAYTEELVYFDAFIDPTTGFGSTTTKSNLNTMTPGEGTYRTVYNMENFAAGYEGIQNRTIFPLQAPNLNASNLTTATTITQTATGTAGEDVVTFSATVAGTLVAGNKITISGNTYEIKYLIDTTHAVLTSVLLTSPSTTAITKVMQYDMIVIKFNNPDIESTVTTLNSEQQIVIAAPAGVAGSAHTVQSAAVQGLLAILNPYMASTPGAFSAITL